MQTEQQKPLVDFDGTQSTQYEKARIDEDAYDAVIAAVKLEEMPSFDDRTKKESKFVFVCKIDKNELPLFVSPVIKKSGGTKGYSNSKLYDILDKSKLLEEAKNDSEILRESYASMQLWLTARLVNRKVRVQVKNSNKGTEKEYSRVADILRFI